jgi:cholesterol oxidase
MYKPQWLSKSAEHLLREWPKRQTVYDVVVVGSGYGGAVAAARLAARRDGARDLKVCVLERGREHLPGTFPKSLSELPGHVRFSRADQPGPQGEREGLFDLRIGEDVAVLVASGLGGGSLINAGVVAAPDLSVFDKNWPAAIKNELPGYYDDVRNALKAETASTVKHDKKSESLAKHVQFRNFAAGLASEAEITVESGKCVQCGDCATGCNVGAKVTLATTYLAQAVQHGAEIYTGATVSHVEQDSERNGWVIHLALTRSPRPLQAGTLHQIRARTVILAAGALGSTEILMRSKERSRELWFSPCLGKRFSTNGDMISAGYNEGWSVNAAALESEKLKDRYVGPTITGIAKVTRENKRITIEELAIPGALRRMFEEVVTTTLMLDNLGKRDREDHFPYSHYDPRLGGRRPKRPNTDPAAVNPRVIRSCQVFAAMGDDESKGRLELVPGWDDPSHRHSVHDGAIRVHWPNAGKQKIFELQDDEFVERAKAGGWTYLRNPLWQPLPTGLSEALSGKKPTGMLFSVHPLGGCPMAERSDKGVVDEFGRVFCAPESDKTYPGLLVLDASIVPTALAVNPLLTITALAERAVERNPDFRKWSEKSTANPLPQPPKPPSVKPVAPAVTSVRFAERMTGPVQLRRPRVGHAVRQDKQPQAELTLKFGEVRNLVDFLADPLHPLTFKGTLALRDTDADPEPFASVDVKGRVQLLVRGASTSRKRIWKALWAYLRTRGGADFFGKLLNRARKGSRGRLNLSKLLKSIRGYVDLASNVGEIRYLFYKFTLEQKLVDKAGNRLPAGTTIKGRKTLEYRFGGNPWRQLVDLELKAKPPGRSESFAIGTLTVDLAYLFRGFALQLEVVRQRDLPATWMDLASLALFIARLILKIHFWSFRLPEYQKFDPMRDVRRLPGPLEPLHMERHIVGYPETPRDAGVFLPITRYRRDEDESGSPVLLIHGLGSSGIQFATPRVTPNLVRHLANHGFDVWVAELRTSIALPSSLDQWTLDEVARLDIPRIVDLVLAKTGKDQIDVVAHCIGSAMFCTAVLDGKLQNTSGGSKIRSAVLLQVGPLVTLSKGTRLRTLVAAPMRRFLPDGHLDFSVDDRAGWAQSAIDRLLSSYPYPADEVRHHRLRWWPPSNRHIANCNRWAAIDGLMIRHENLGREMLNNLGEILGHASITTWTQTIQYGFLERLTDSNGVNSYVTDRNLREYFRFPVRFLHGEDNDVFHPLTSLRSLELLKRVHGPAFPADVKLLPKYRHLDPLIGEDGDKKVFHYISAFLKEPGRVPAPMPRPRAYYFRRPLIGPLLGWTRYDNNTKSWIARVWCRLDDLRSPVSYALIQVCAGGKCGPTRLVRPAEKPGEPIEFLSAGPMDTILCVDVQLGSAPGRYDIFVLSAHEGAKQPTARKHRAAELAAGKRLSARKPHLVVEDRPIEQRLADPAEFQHWLEQARGAAGEYDEKIDHAEVRVPEQGALLRFAVASCRYPGWLFDRKLADATFGALRSHAAQAPLSALFLVGDQIYADATAGVFDPRDRRERFYEAYREAWTAPNAAAVLSRVPVCMAMDDHEAGNDWHPADLCSGDEHAMREEGLAAFRRYQWLHSRGNRGQPKARPPERDVFYYDFELAGFPVFVCDTRTGRVGRRRILGNKQFKALTEWLADHRDQPKFVVSPSVVVPYLSDPERAQHSDGWDGCESQLRGLFSWIAVKGIQDVVFLCGDSHLCNCSEIKITDRSGVVAKAYCIVASPMYAPYPFANAQREEFLPDNENDPLMLANNHEMRYQVKSWVECDSFSVVTADAKGFSVTIGDKPALCFDWSLAGSRTPAPPMAPVN